MCNIARNLEGARDSWTGNSPRLSRELLVRAVDCRIQEVASDGLHIEMQRHHRQIGLGLQQTERLRIRPQLKPGTPLMREWQGRG